MLSDSEITRLGEPGYFVKDGFLGRDVALAVRADALRWYSEGKLKRAGVGRGGEHRLDVSIRGDSIAWVTREEATPGLVPLWDAFEALRTELNEKAYLGLRRFELQLACYPGHGERYAKHRDAFGHDDNRRLTAIVYLNPEWRPEHGGQLRVHAGGVLDVAPVIDRLIVFTSAKVEHEVLPSFADRWAATAWYSAR